MRIPGIIGGIGPESTVVYYRSLVAAFRERTGGDRFPHLILNSIDVRKLLSLIEANSLSEMTDWLVEEVRRLWRAGAAFGALAAGTPHVVFDAVQEKSPIPLVSIVDAACRDAGARGLRRLGLFGTRRTMEGRFYPDAFARAGMTLVAPEPEERDYIHERYVGELIPGIVRDETRAGLLAIADRMKSRQGIQGLILGGTELTLILGAADGPGIPLLDTTAIHVDAIVARMLEENV